MSFPDLPEQSLLHLDTDGSTDTFPNRSLEEEVFSLLIASSSSSPPSLSSPSSSSSPLKNITTNATLIDEDVMAALRFERIIGIVIPTLFAFVILVGLIGNVLVVVVVFVNRQMRNSTNTLIIGLALADLLFLTLCVPFTAIGYALHYWPFPEWWCSIMNYLQACSAYASVWTLTLMAVDRFLAVVFPIRSMTLRTNRNTVVSLIILYLTIAATQAHNALVFEVVKYGWGGEQRSACVIVFHNGNRTAIHEARAHYMVFNMFGYLVPLGITCLLYYFMLRRLWTISKPGAHSMRCTAAEPGTVGRSSENVRAKKKVTRMVMGVVIAFAVCWMPLNVCFFLTGLLYPDDLVRLLGITGVIAQIFSQVLAYTNSCLNPILYAFLSDNFRKGFFKIISYCLLWLSCGRWRFKIGGYVRTDGRIELEHTHTPWTRSTNKSQQQTSSIRSSSVHKSSVSAVQKDGASSAMTAGNTNNSATGVTYNINNNNKNTLAAGDHQQNRTAERNALLGGVPRNCSAGQTLGIKRGHASNNNNNNSNSNSNSNNNSNSNSNKSSNSKKKQASLRSRNDNFWGAGSKSVPGSGKYSQRKRNRLPAFSELELSEVDRTSTSGVCSSSTFN